MFTSFSTALSALAADSTAIDVVGNNLANLNTPGFKTSAVRFRDLVTESLGAGLGETQVGFGTGQPLTIREFSQGAIQTSSGLLDAAVQGDGFFVVNDSSGNQLYTRAGSFQTDKMGNLLTDTGYKVQGWTTVDPTTGQIDTNGSVTNIVVPVGSLKAPVATSAFTADLNLNSAAAADSTSAFTTPLPVYDSLAPSTSSRSRSRKREPTSGAIKCECPGTKSAAEPLERRSIFPEPAAPSPSARTAS
jgi:flagellar hook protein FlgE